LLNGNAYDTEYVKIVQKYCKQLPAFRFPRNEMHEKVINFCMALFDPKPDFMFQALFSPIYL
jgi:hypothetical protein